MTCFDWVPAAPLLFFRRVVSAADSAGAQGVAHGDFLRAFGVAAALSALEEYARGFQADAQMRQRLDALGLQSTSTLSRS
ncbi:hypothetical protein LSG25_13985 [Paralcaligenes sp. KSB-10]|uniref:hypothetical protein n=1 Tax=Paralcaligenes sp. KSB-10 TaxID=2901142 RepID=UPI001E2F3999|nr:hypothetical protein [Paralcaligenes sp. KSB-10]UHL63165.1 hypothetical protein LSG25_13985 [Paralcaligenes sp. KSB-10]